MSNGPIPLLTTANLSFTPGTPDFTDFVASELGNLGTDSDGFDLLLSDTISLSDEAGTLLTSFDGDLVDAGNSIAAFSIGDPATDQASLISAGNAVDAALTDYTGTLPASADSGTVAQPGPPQPYQPPKGVTVLNLPTMKAGNPIYRLLIDEEQRQTGDPQEITVTLTDGDRDIFRIDSATKRTVNIGAGSASLDTTWYLSVTPAKTGTFYARVDDRSQSLGSTDTFSYYKVIITQ
jgi:hypothetical protein